MNYIDGNGDYAFIPGTRRLDSSDHPVYRARNEVALGQGEWIHAPERGHQLARFKTVKQSQSKVEEFRKELALYLSKYGPKVTDALVTRGGVTLTLEIKDSALKEAEANGI
jgi:hypothetical protein